MAKPVEFLFRQGMVRLPGRGKRLAGVFFAGKIAEQFLQEKRQACGGNGQSVVGMGPGQGNAALHGVKACSVPVFFFVVKPFRGAGRNEVARVSIGVLMKKSQSRERMRLARAKRTRNRTSSGSPACMPEPGSGTGEYR